METAGILETEGRNLSDVEVAVLGSRMVILNKEERLRDDDKGKEEAKQGFC